MYLLYSYFVECGNSNGRSVIDVCIVDSFIVYNHFFFTSIQKRTGCSAWLCVPRTS